MLNKIFGEPRTRASISWGGQTIPLSASGRHFCVAGATGSGKTVTLRLFLQSILPLIRPGSDSRAILFDAKRDLYSMLFGMLGIDPQDQSLVRTMAPDDSRGWGWDICADVRSHPAALQIATALIAQEADSNPFFTNAARDIVCGIQRSFIKSGRPWTLRDLLLATMNQNHLRAILSRHPNTAHLIDRYFHNERLLLDILATLGAKLMCFEPIASAHWHAKRAGRMVSLQDWASNAHSHILLLASDDANRAAADAINRVVFKRASELLLAAGNSTSRRSFVVLDELSKMGRVDGLEDLLVRGRSCGVTVALGFQDIDSLRAPTVYGENLANVIVGQCAYKALLRMYSRPTADWASQLIGDVEHTEEVQSISSGSSGTSTSTTFQRRKDEAVLATQFLTLPLADDERHSGWFVSPERVWRSQIKHRPLLVPRDERVSDFDPRPPEDYDLPPWSAEELRELGIAAQPLRRSEVEERKASSFSVLRLRRNGGVAG